MWAGRGVWGTCDRVLAGPRPDPAAEKAPAASAAGSAGLDERHYASPRGMAAAVRIDRGYLGRILRPSLLAPDIVEASWMGSNQRGCGY